MVVREFQVVGMVLKGKDRIPTLQMVSADNEKLEVHLESKQELKLHSIDEQFSVDIKRVRSTQATLSDAEAKKEIKKAAEASKQENAAR